MPVYELTPDENLSDLRGANGQKSWSGGNPGSTVPTALSDSSDSTYTRSQAQGRPQDVGLGLLDVSGFTDEAVVCVAPYARTKRSSSRSARVVASAIGWVTEGTGRATRHRMAVFEGTCRLVVPKAGSAGNHEVAAGSGQVYNPGTGAPWDHDVNDVDPMLTIYDNASTAEGETGPATFYKAGAKVYTQKGATYSTTAPAGTVTDTQFPTIAATISALVEDWHVASATPWLTGLTVEVFVERQSDSVVVYHATERIDIAGYGDGVTPTAYAFTHQMTEPLPNGQYRAYVLPYRDLPWSEDDAKVTAWGNCPPSAGSPHNFTMNLARPAAPVLTLDLDDDEQRIGVSVTTDGTGFDDDTFRVDVQRSDDQGATWSDVYGMKDRAVTVGACALGSDWYAPRGQEVEYRARCCAENDSNAELIYSEWCTPVVTDSWSVTGWNLKLVGDESNSWLAAPIKGEPAAALEEPSTVLLPLDREGAVVVTGGQYGTSGDYAVSAVGSTAIAALERVVEHQGLVYVETAYGEALWVRIVAPSWSYLGTLSSPRRRATLPWREVTAPEA